MTYPTSPEVTVQMAYDRAGNLTWTSASKYEGTECVDYPMCDQWEPIYTYFTSLSYTYAQGTADKAMRQSVTDNMVGKTTSYTYDAQNRLTRAQATAGGTDDYQYTHDANANRTSQTVNGTVTHYAYNAADQLCWSAPTAGACGSAPTGATTYTYDPTGNETSVSGRRTMAYNAKAQTTSVTPAGAAALPMAYADADQSERVSAGGTAFTSSPLGVGLSKTGTASTYYTRDDQGNLVSKRDGSTSLYYFFDGLGSVVGMVDGAAGSVASYAYDPYGQTLSAAGSAAAANPWRFAGGYLDPQTVLIKFGARYYDPSVGRWTQQDPSGQDANAYAYVGGDPVNFVDPSGLFLEKVINGFSILNALKDLYYDLRDGKVEDTELVDDLAGALATTIVTGGCFFLLGLLVVPSAGTSAAGAGVCALLAASVSSAIQVGAKRKQGEGMTRTDDPAFRFITVIAVAGVPILIGLTVFLFLIGRPSGGWASLFATLLHSAMVGGGTWVKQRNMKR